MGSGGRRAEGLEWEAAEGMRRGWNGKRQKACGRVGRKTAVVGMG